MKMSKIRKQGTISQVKLKVIQARIQVESPINGIIEKHKQIGK
jgi:hypothetical protein